MSEDVQDTVPTAPVDQAPTAAAVTLDPATAAAIAQVVVTAMQAANPPAPPVTPVDVPAPKAARALAAPAAEPVDEVPYTEVFKPGSLAVHTYDHFGRTRHQIMLVVDVYQVPVVDPRTAQVTGVQDRVRMLQLGVADELADLPADAPALLPAAEFYAEDAA